jgi:hypothetical protein
MPRKPLALAATVLLALLAPAAHAAIVPGQVIDGPSADVQRFGDIDIAPDGTGALVYTKNVGGNPNVWASTFNGTAWSAPANVSGNECPAPTSCVDPHVAAGNGGRVVIVFKANGASLQAVLKPNAASPFGVPVKAAASNTAQGGDVDMDPVSGVAYAVVDQNSVTAARLVGSTWTDVDSGLLIDGTSTHDIATATPGAQNTARVAVDSSGNAVVAWPADDGGTKHVFARRINGTTRAPSSIQIDVPSLFGKPADGANADSVSIDGGGSANPWIAIRQQFTYGTTGRVRNIARQLVGDTPSAAQPLDGLPNDTPTEGAEAPRIDVNPAGQGIADGARQLTFQTFGSLLSAGIWAPGFRLDAGTPTANEQPSVAIADSGNGLYAWMDSSVATTFANAREEVGGVTGAPFTLSRSADGPILTALDAPIGMSSSAGGKVAVAFGQGNGTTTNEIVAAVVDLPQPTAQPTGPAAKPAVSGLRFSRKVFAQGKRLATVSKRRRHKVGTTISFNVSLQSTTTFSFAKKTKGFRSGRRCVAHRPKGHRKARRCTRYVKSGSMSFSTAAGTHRVHFEGRLSRRKRLKPGSYRLTVVSANSAGRSPAKRASFRLLKR